jgi:hypothetical protein
MEYTVGDAARSNASHGNDFMWVIQTTAEYLVRSKRYEKKRWRELEAVLDNLDTFVKTLQNGVKSGQIKFGFIHPEPHGVLALDQKGGGSNLAQTRLYVYPDEEKEVLYLLTLGDKQSQRADIQFCKTCVLQLRGGDEQTDA